MKTSPQDPIISHRPTPGEAVFKHVKVPREPIYIRKGSRDWTREFAARWGFTIQMLELRMHSWHAHIDSPLQQNSVHLFCRVGLGVQQLLTVPLSRAWLYHLCTVFNKFFLLGLEGWFFKE